MVRPLPALRFVCGFSVGGVPRRKWRREALPFTAQLLVRVARRAHHRCSANIPGSPDGLGPAGVSARGPRKRSHKRFHQPPELQPRGRGPEPLVRALVRTLCGPLGLPRAMAAASAQAHDRSSILSHAGLQPSSGGPRPLLLSFFLRAPGGRMFFECAIRHETTYTEGSSRGPSRGRGSMDSGRRQRKRRRLRRRRSYPEWSRRRWWSSHFRLRHPRNSGFRYALS